MPALTFRAATGADLRFMLALIAADDVGTPMDHPADADAPEYARALAAIDADPNHELYIVELARQRIGTFQLTFLPGIMRRGMWRGLIESVHVVPEERGKGHGTQMMRWAVDRLCWRILNR